MTEPWFYAAAVFNLSSVSALRNWFEDAEVEVLNTANGRYTIQRSVKRQAPPSSSVSNPNSQLISITEHVDQHGWLQTPQNFKDSVDKNPSRKYEMLQSADSVLDGFSQVQYPITISLICRSLCCYFRTLCTPGKCKAWSIIELEWVTIVELVMLISGLRNILLSGYVGLNYAEFGHLDYGEIGPTLDFRASSKPTLGKSFYFPYSSMRKQVWYHHQAYTGNSNTVVWGFV
jgi:hypothetical protein